MAEKQWPEPKNLNSLKISASFDTLLDPRGTKVVKKSQFIYFVLKFDHSGALYNSFLFVKIISRFFFIDLKVIKGVSLTFSQSKLQNLQKRPEFNQKRPFWGGLSKFVQVRLKNSGPNLKI